MFGCVFIIIWMKFENISMLRRCMCYTYIDEGSTPSISTDIQNRPLWAVFVYQLEYKEQANSLACVGCWKGFIYFREFGEFEKI